MVDDYTKLLWKIKIRMQEFYDFSIFCVSILNIVAVFLMLLEYNVKPTLELRLACTFAGIGLLLIVLSFYVAERICHHTVVWYGKTPKATYPKWLSQLSILVKLLNILAGCFCFFASLFTVGALFECVL